MSDPTLHTALLEELLPRLRAGDSDARNELIRAAQGRLASLTRRMLRKFPSVSRWVEADDVFSGAALRLLRALEATPVADTRGFLNLSAAVIRRELIDLARHFQGAHGVGANHDSVAGPDGVVPDMPDRSPGEAELARWTALHEAAFELPVEERETFMLTFYHGWKQPQIAELFQVDERTVRRRWRAAVTRLSELLGELPGE